MEISRTDLAKPGMVVQFGLPPLRIDLLTEVTGLDFVDAWKDRTI